MKINKLKDLFFQIAGVGNPIILISFIWYLFNAVIYVKHGLYFKTELGGFKNIESYFSYAIIFTYIPHFLCMEKGKHDFLGNEFMTNIVIVSVAFGLHYTLSFSAISGSAFNGY